MTNVVRFGVSVEKEVLDILDSYVETNHFPNRSQAVRHLIQKFAAEKQNEGNEVMGGTLTVIYDHHKRELQDKMVKIQHDYHHVILCSQHIHLDHDNCMEIIAMKGKAFILNELANKLKAVKGIVHGELSMTKIL